MSTDRRIDRICAAVTVLTVLLAVLCMNGAAAGSGSGGDGRFTADDLDGAWDASGAGVIDLTAGHVTGGGAYMADGDVHILGAGKYVLTGTMADGRVVVEAGGNDSVWLLLDGADIRCADSAALTVEQAGKVFLTLAEGTENALSGGAASGSVDGVIYSRDDLTINGTGSLTVTAEYQHGIVCNDDLVITGGTISVSAVQDGLHANDSVRIAGGTLSITAGDDGVTVSNDDGTGYFYMQAGSLSIPSCYEGVEAAAVTIDGGTVDISSEDDGVNAVGGGEDGCFIAVNGGTVRIVNSQGRDADGMDSNGDILIGGGKVFISVAGTGGNIALDYGSESGGVCRIDGGTVVACGSGTMAEAVDPASGQGFVTCAVSGGADGSLTLADGSGNTLLEESIPNAFTCVTISVPGMTAGDAYTVTVDGVPVQVTAGEDARGAAGAFMGGPSGAFPGRRMDGGTMGQFQGAAPEEPAEGVTEDRPAMPADGELSGEAALQDPGGAFPGRKMDGGAMGQFQGAAPEERAESVTEDEPAGIPAEELVLLGVSVLVLLAGLLAAARFRR